MATFCPRDRLHGSFFTKFIINKLKQLMNTVTDMHVMFLVQSLAPAIMIVWKGMYYSRTLEAHISFNIKHSKQLKTLNYKYKMSCLYIGLMYMQRITVSHR